MHSNAEISGAAALSICEALLLSLIDTKVLSKIQAIEVLVDAAEAHRNAILLPGDAELHKAVSDLIDDILAGRNSVRFL